MKIYTFRTRALRLEERKDSADGVMLAGWYLTIATDGPPITIGLGTEKPELPLELIVEVTP